MQRYTKQKKLVLPFGVFINNFEHVQHIDLVFLSILNMHFPEEQRI